MNMRAGASRTRPLPLPAKARR